MRLPKLPKFRIPKPARPQRVASDVVEVAGLGCLVGAGWWWVPIVGLVATGLVLLLIGRVMDR